jgi:hypothetical protein
MRDKRSPVIGTASWVNDLELAQDLVDRADSEGVELVGPRGSQIGRLRATR